MTCSGLSNYHNITTCFNSFFLILHVEVECPFFSQDPIQDTLHSDVMTSWTAVECSRFQDFMLFFNDLESFEEYC